MYENKKTHYFVLHFYGNIQFTYIDNTSIVTQNKREFKKSQKYQFENFCFLTRLGITSAVIGNQYKCIDSKINIIFFKF